MAMKKIFENPDHYKQRVEVYENTNGDLVIRSVDEDEEDQLMVIQAEDAIDFANEVMAVAKELEEYRARADESKPSKQE